MELVKFSSINMPTFCLNLEIIDANIQPLHSVSQLEIAMHCEGEGRDGACAVVGSIPELLGFTILIRNRIFRFSLSSKTQASKF